MNLKNKITILITFWNTPKIIFENCLRAAAALNFDIIIVNDQSDKKYYNELLEIVKNISFENEDIEITILTPPEKRMQEGATYYGLEFISTPYVIRIDSDDYIESLPNLPDNWEEYDIINTRKLFAKNINEFYNTKTYTNLNGLIVKRDIFLFAYSDWRWLNNYHCIYPEDTFTWAKLFLLKPNLKIHSIYETQIYFANKLARQFKCKTTHESRQIITQGKKFKRIEVLLTIMILYNLPKEIYIQASKKILLKG